MKRAILLLCVLLSSSAWLHTGSGAGAQGIPRVLAEPLEGHPGDIIYVSGDDFAPNTNLFVTFACPNYRSALPGNEVTWGGSRGPHTNAQGTFVGYKIKTFHLNGLSESNCQIYATDNGNPFETDIPFLYFLRAPGDPLSRGAHHIKVSVLTHPNRVQGGLSENILLSGWPGAYATVALSYPGTQPAQRSVRLDWDGRAALHWPISRVPRNLTAHVNATVHLGPSHGSGVASFLILH